MSVQVCNYQQHSQNKNFYYSHTPIRKYAHVLDALFNYMQMYSGGMATNRLLHTDMYMCTCTYTITVIITIINHCKLVVDTMAGDARDKNGKLGTTRDSKHP